jgi:hypothetical protein
MREIGSNYPCGPCPDELPMKCTCGKILTDDNIGDKDCGDGCEVCYYCGIGKCPDCGEHIHCGGCV